MRKATSYGPGRWAIARSEDDHFRCNLLTHHRSSDWEPILESESPVIAQLAAYRYQALCQPRRNFRAVALLKRCTDKTPVREQNPKNTHVEARLRAGQ